jgi:hypothetical protein
LSPTSTENSAGRAGKYASLIENLNKSAQAVLLGIDAEIKAAGTAPAPTPAAPAAPAAPAPVAKAAGEADPEGEKAAAAAGEDLATILLGSPLSEEKRAATEQAMVAKVASCIQYGELLADDYGAYLQGLSETLQKSANEEAMAAMAGGAPPGMPPEGEPGAGAPPPEGGGGGDEAAIMAMLQGGQGMPPVSLEQLLASGGGEGSNPEIEALIQAVLAQEGGGEGETGGMPWPPCSMAMIAASSPGHRLPAEERRHRVRLPAACPVEPRPPWRPWLLRWRTSAGFR